MKRKYLAIILLPILCLSFLWVGYSVGTGAAPNHPDYHLDQSTADYSYKICTDGDGWYWAVNGSDGSVCWTSTNASATAINALATVNPNLNYGIQTFVFTGNMNFDSQITLTNNTKIVLVSATLNMVSANKNLFYVPANTWNVEIGGGILSYTAAGTPTAGAGIYTEQTGVQENEKWADQPRIYIHDMQIRDFYWGLVLNNRKPACTNIQLFDCVSAGFLDISSDGVFHHFTIENCPYGVYSFGDACDYYDFQINLASTAALYHAAAGASCNFYGGFYESSGVGIHLDGVANDLFYGGFIINNDGIGIRIEDSVNNTFASCNINGANLNRQTYPFYEEGTSDYNTYQSNIITSNTQNPVFVGTHNYYSGPILPVVLGTKGTTISAVADNNGGVTWSCLWTAPATGPLKSISVYTNSSAATNNVMGLYDYNGTAGISPILTSTLSFNSATMAYRSADFTNPPLAIKGHIYLLSWSSASAGDDAKGFICYTATGAATNQLWLDSGRNPTVLTGASGKFNYAMDIYATYY